MLLSLPSPVSPLDAIAMLEALPPFSASLPRRIAASNVKLLPIFDSRAYHNDDAVKTMVQALSEGVTLPPLEVYPRGDRIFLMDGHMRLEAHREWARSKGREGAFTVPVVAFQGTPIEAVLGSVKRNSKHGVRLSRTERTGAAWKLVLIDRGLTRDQIAEASATCRRTINTMRSTRRKLGDSAASYTSWEDARLAAKRDTDISLEDMLDRREARAERCADQLVRSIGTSYADDPELMVRVMWHYMGRKRSQFAYAVADHFRDDVEAGGEPAGMEF